MKKIWIGKILGTALVCLMIVAMFCWLPILGGGAQDSDTGLANSPWPMFRHDPQHTGRSPYTGPETPTLKWSYVTRGCIRSSPAIGSDGTIYVGSEDGNLYAINPDGTLKWSYATGDDVDSSPAIGSDGTIYIGSYVSGEDCNLYAINPDGSLKWRYLTGGYIGSSPVIGSDGTIYVGSDDHYLYAIGEAAQPTPTPLPTITPVLATEDAFNYKGEYTLDETKLREEEKKVLPYVMKYAKEYKLSPCLIMAVIRQESGFFDYSQDPDKDKTKFDIGYMQVSHIAAIDTYKKYTGDEYKGTEDEWQKDGLDPDINIKYGTRYLRIQYERIKDGHYKDVYNDILKSTLSAYNAGHPTKDNSKYVDEVINGSDIINGQRRGYEFFLTIRVPVGGVPAPEKGIPGFEATFAIAGLLAVAYLLRRKK
ncbi:MAG: PQQ-binding-like beta-propeller repeat protein [archaeon]|nr:PQQ-binding-like beta-propeller repeat protein [archaeon]